MIGVAQSPSMLHCRPFRCPIVRDTLLNKTNPMPACRRNASWGQVPDGGRRPPPSCSHRLASAACSVHQSGNQW